MDYHFIEHNFIALWIQWVSENRTSGFWHFSFLSGCKIVRISDIIWNPDINVRLSDVRLFPIRTSGSNRLEPVPNRFRHLFCIRRPVGNDWNRTSDNQRLELEWTGRPITAQLCPVIRCCLKSGGFYNRTCFENAEIRTSGFQTSTVYI